MKIYQITLLTLACAIANGCETSSAVMGASQQGMGGLGCSEIYNTFQAYNRDRQSVDAAKNLAAALGIPYTGSSGNFYNTAKAAANVALLAQGCQPI